MSTPTPQVLHPYVERNPAIHGGRPIIKGTRIPVTSIVQNYQRGLSVEEILGEFPQLSPSAVYDALSYYHDHRGEMDKELAELTDVSEAMRRYPPTLPRSDDAR
jgi:uncharacterized protein (DUF433 family)